MLADFVRWHSPNDWRIDATLPQGGELSARMRDPNNTWHALWKRATARRAVDQKPLFNAEKEANRALHYLESLTPLDLLSQCVGCIFAALCYLLTESTTTRVLATVLAGVPTLLGWDCTDATLAALRLPIVRKALRELTHTLEASWTARRQDAMTREELHALTTVLSNVEQLLARCTSLFAKVWCLPRNYCARHSKFQTSFRAARA